MNKFWELVIYLFQIKQMNKLSFAKLCLVWNKNKNLEHVKKIELTNNTGLQKRIFGLRQEWG